MSNEKEEKRLSPTDSRLMLLRKKFGIQDKEKKTYLFSIYATLVDQPTKKFPIAEEETGLKTFDAYLETVENMDVHTLYVTTYKNRKDKTGVEWKLDMKEEMDMTKEIDEAVSLRIEKLKTDAVGLNGTEPLGQINYDHLGTVLKLETAKQIDEMRHNNTVRDFNRTISDLEDSYTSQKKQIAKLEEEKESLEAEFEEFKNAKLSGISAAISDAGGQILGNLAKQFLPTLLGNGGAPVDGIANGSKTAMVESNDAIGEFMDQLRVMVTPYDDDTLLKFFTLMEVINEDSNNLDIILKFLQPNK